MYQKLMLVGSLGKNPEMRYLPDGKAVTNFSIAVNSREKVGDDWQEVATWWNIKTFGKLAENCNQYLSKGKRVFVEGEPKIRTYTKKDGTMGVSCDCNATNVVFLSPKDTSDGQPESVGVTDAEAELPF